MVRTGRHADTLVERICWRWQIGYSHSVCESYKKRKVLGGSFFFSRNDVVRNKTNALIRTLAHQTEQLLPLRGPISEALKDSSLLHSSSARQLQELIVGPIEEISSALTSPILFVIDGIDECEGEDQEISVLHIIKLLANELSVTSASIKILITGRQSEHVITAFSQPSVASQSGILILHEVDDIDLDLCLYISTKLRVIANTYSRGFNTRGWPSEPEMDALFAASGGTFASAATLLEGLMVNGDSPLDQRPLYLDWVYRGCLSLALRHHPSRNAHSQLSTLLAFILLSFESLPASSLDALLAIESTPLLAALQPFIYRHGDPPHSTRERSSFRDFITTPLRCHDQRLVVDPPRYHCNIAQLCLEKLNSGLNRNILDVEGPQVMNTDVQDRVEDIPKDLCYAAKHWLSHFVECQPDDRVVALLEVFLRSKAMYWIELLSYLGYLEEGRRKIERMSELLVSFRRSSIRNTHIYLSRPVSVPP